jgi:hypothetical protein
MSDFKVYDPNAITCLVSLIPISGFADGSMVTVETEGEDFVDVCGTDGMVVRSKNLDKRATATIRLMQSSTSNDDLSALRLQDELAGNGAGVGPFLLKDDQGSTLVVAEKSWIMKPPVTDFDKQAKEREWKIRLAKAVIFNGGN